MHPCGYYHINTETHTRLYTSNCRACGHTYRNGNTLNYRMVDLRDVFVQCGHTLVGVWGNQQEHWTFIDVLLILPFHLVHTHTHPLSFKRAVIHVNDNGYPPSPPTWSSCLFRESKSLSNQSGSRLIRILNEWKGDNPSVLISWTGSILWVFFRRILWHDCLSNTASMGRKMQPN